MTLYQTALNASIVAIGSLFFLFPSPLVTGIFAPGGQRDVVHDTVLANGRVIDPETRIDATRHIGISNGRIAAISTTTLNGKEVIDVSGLVVAPGFIDLHAHGQDRFSSSLQAMDGVTTALEMEIGVFPVSSWYASREGKSPINYGATVGHVPARLKLKHDLDAGHVLTGGGLAAMGNQRAWAYDAATPAEIDKLKALVDQGLSEGALGVGYGINYTPGATREEILALFGLAAERKAANFVHIRHSSETEPGSSVEAVQEMIANAAATGASVHIVHIGSVGLGKVSLLLQMIEGARGAGLDITTEVYPYTAGSTFINSAIFDPGWRDRLGADYRDIEWAATGERLTEDTFKTYRKEKPEGIIIAHVMKEEFVQAAIAHPLVMIASDGMVFINGRAHPRGAGTFARVLGRYVREKKILTLMEAIQKMTLMPALRLEASAPEMRLRGRIKVGSYADITVFDAARVIDNATFEQPARPSSGIVHVIVGGEFVLRDSKFIESSLPGKPIRGVVQRKR